MKYIRGISWIAISAFLIIAAMPLLVAAQAPAIQQTQMTPQTPESLEAVVDWRNLENAISRLIQANEARAAALTKAQQDATALADYWSKYVAGLSAHK